MPAAVFAHLSCLDQQAGVDLTWVHGCTTNFPSHRGSSQEIPRSWLLRMVRLAISESCDSDQSSSSPLFKHFSSRDFSSYLVSGEGAGDEIMINRFRTGHHTQVSVSHM